MTQKHPGRQILPWMKQGSIYSVEFFRQNSKGESLPRWFRKEVFSGRVFPNKTPAEHVDFVAAEVKGSVATCLVRLEQTKGEGYKWNEAAYVDEFKREA